MPDPDTLHQLKASFRGRGPLIDRLFADCEEFRSLCVDYCQCAAAVDYWRRQPTGVATTRHEEYAELLIELDREIENWLDAAECRRNETAGPDKSIGSSTHHGPGKESS